MSLQGGIAMANQNNNAALLTTLAIGGAGALLAEKALKRKRREFDLHGKVALVTGGSRGLGLVLARELAAQGAKVAITARDAEELERARADLESRGADVFAVACNVTDKAQVDDCVRQVRERFGRIDALINNAGIIQVAPLELMTLEDFERAMNTHFWGALYMTLAVLPEMRRRKSGRIVNIASIGGKIAVPHLAPYSASKFALVGLSDALRSELMKDNVFVTTVCPGLMRTGSPRNADFKGQHKAEFAWFVIGDSLPATSINAERAASQIISAMRAGKAELIITFQAELAAKFRALFPEITSDLLALVNQFILPDAQGGDENIGRASAKGKDSESWRAPALVTALTDAAAQRNNEAA